MSCTTIEAAAKELEKYGQVEAGWDLDKGVPPNPAHVALAQSFLKALPEECAAPTPMLGTNGTVGFYWNERPFYLDAQIEEGDRFSVLIPSTRRGERDRWYPSVTLAEFVALYTAHVLYWVLELNGVTGLMP